MTDQIAEIVGLIVVAAIGLVFPVGVFIFVAPPQWLDDWMDERAEKRQKRRAERQKRKKPA